METETVDIITEGAKFWAGDCETSFKENTARLPLMPMQNVCAV